MRLWKEWLIAIIGLCFMASALADNGSFLTPVEEESLLKGVIQEVEQKTGRLVVDNRVYRLSPATRIFWKHGEPASSWNLHSGMRVGLLVNFGSREQAQNIFGLFKIVIIEAAER